MKIIWMLGNLFLLGYEILLPSLETYGEHLHFFFAGRKGRSYMERVCYPYSGTPRQASLSYNL